MDLCGPMRIASINGKRITVLLQSPVIIIRTDNGTEFKNQVLKVYFDSVGITHQLSSVRTPQQNGVVERRNRTLVEAARTMLIFSRAPLFLWAEAIATACFTQNRSIIHRRFNKTPYELINGRKPDISFLHVFGALCYPKNDREDIGKLGAKAMSFEQRSLKPELQCMTSGQISSGLDLTYAPRPPSWTINHLRVNVNIMDRSIGVDESHLCLSNRVMSSPNYPTSVIEDAFSSNFPDYIPASLNYVPTLLGKAYSSSSNDSFGLVLIASPSLLLFHDDPYMKVIHSYDAKESPIPSPTIVPPSLMFNSQEFLLLKKLLPPKKHGRDQSSSSTPTPPQEFKIGESSRKTSLEHHEEQIKEILNHLDELSLNRIENMEDNIEVADSVTAALEAQATNMENADNTNINIEPREALVARKCSYKEFMSCQPFNFKGSEGDVGLIRWFERTKSVFSLSNYTEDCKVKFANGTLTEEAPSWWNSFAQPIRIEEAYKITWVEFMKLLIKKYCPRTEIQKMEDEFYHLTVKGNDLKTYVRRFQELETLCPTMVLNSEKMIEAFIEGLP
nr:reverse transcriptase domain-containing protein [Tanacetum cinerariifolium]